MCVIVYVFDLPIHEMSIIINKKYTAVFGQPNKETR